DGCGKSILGLHLASHYVHDNYEIAVRKKVNNAPLVLYVSTDLSSEQAHHQWKAFGLNFPANRDTAITEAYAAVESMPHFDSSESEIQLVPIGPFVAKEDDKSIGAIFNRQLPDAQQALRQVFFMDLHRETAGDDWGFLNRLVGLLPAGQDVPPLVIVDAIEGLETFVGETDQFGQGRSRRSRVAQLARLAAQINVQLVFIAEESDEDVRLPEQYVSDLVIRVRHVFDGDYTQRFIEIEKCRGVAHVRGVHEFAIRSGGGTRTSELAMNIDDPRIVWIDGTDDNIQLRVGGPTLDMTTLAHVQVINSLHRRSRKIRDNPHSTLELVGRPTFGLPLFDKRIPRRLLRSDLRYQQYVPDPEMKVKSSEGSFTALIGAPGTYKGRLSRRFLANAFPVDDSGKLDEHNAGVVVLITTDAIDPELLIPKIVRHLGIDPSDNDLALLQKHVLCRRINVRYLSSSAFLQLIDRYVYKAQALLLKCSGIRELLTTKSSNVRQQVSHRVRLVISDWKVITSVHSNIDRDPMVLQSIVSAVKREGLTSLLVSSQEGSLLEHSVKYGGNDPARLDENQIRTWDLSFFGEQRVAIGHKGSYASDAPTSIFELCPSNSRGESDNELLSVDRHFSLYEGVERGVPTRIPLCVRLYGGSHSPSEASTPQFVKVVSDAFSQVFVPVDSGEDVVRFDPSESYDGFFTFADSLDASRLDHTLVFEIDEFWTDDKPSLLDLREYWTATVATKETDDDCAIRYVQNREEDIYGIFHPHPRDWELVYSCQCTKRHVTTFRNGTMPKPVRDGLEKRIQNNSVNRNVVQIDDNTWCQHGSDFKLLVRNCKDQKLRVFRTPLATPDRAVHNVSESYSGRTTPNGVDKKWNTITRSDMFRSTAIARFQ
ncbi:MAG: hypothetical protein KDB27_26930, partial [Planctomycetales bacterium]|nr:hypothetical protein [Planctomycetales bacterium]